MTAKAGSAQAAGGPGRVRQAAIFRAGARGHMPSIPTNASSLERRAKKAMSRTAWAYVAGGAGEGRTMRHNRESFERWRIVPRMLRGTPAARFDDLSGRYPAVSASAVSADWGGVDCRAQQRRDHRSRGSRNRHGVRDLLSGL